MPFLSIVPKDFIGGSWDFCFIWRSVIGIWRRDAHTDLVSGRTRFESRSSHRPYWPKVSVVILVSPDRIVKFQVKDISLLSNPFQFRIYHSSYFWRYSLRPWQCSKIYHKIKITQPFTSRFFSNVPYKYLSTKAHILFSLS